MKKYLVLILSFAIVPSILFAAGKKEGRAVSVAPQSKVFINKMSGDLDKHLAKQMGKQKVPLIIVTNKKEANFLLVGESTELKRKWHQTSADKNQGTIALLNAKSKKQVWTITEGDGSFWWGKLGKTGNNKVAKRMVKQMKKDLFPKAKKQKKA